MGAMRSVGVKKFPPLDVWYVDNQTFWLDTKILLLTVQKVLILDRISLDAEATMSAFKGSTLNSEG